MNSTEKSIDVIVIGELNVDIIFNEIAGFPAVGKEIIANSMSVTLGSSSAIFASNLCSLGIHVSFIGKVGDDTFAHVVLAALKAKGVDTDHIVRSAVLSTGVTIVLNYDQDRANVTYPGAMYDLRLEDVDMNLLSRARHMHFSSCFLQPGIRHDLARLFRQAKAMGLTTSFDPQWDPSEKWEIPLEQLLPNVDVFLPNAQEFMLLTRCRSVNEGIQKLRSYAHYIVIKNGSEGALAWDGTRMIVQPAFLNEKVVDCIGAGDSFNAGFIREFIKKQPLKKCLETGALTGAINTTRAGGTGAFENLNMIRSIARQRFKKEL